MTDRPIRLTPEQWRAALAAYIGDRIDERGGFRPLVDRLSGTPFALDRVPLGNKVRRGSYEAGFLLQLAMELGLERIDVRDIAARAPSVGRTAGGRTDEGKGTGAADSVQIPPTL